MSSAGRSTAWTASCASCPNPNSRSPSTACRRQWPGICWACRTRFATSSSPWHAPWRPLRRRSIFWMLLSVPLRLVRRSSQPRPVRRSPWFRPVRPGSPPSCTWAATANTPRPASSPPPAPLAQNARPCALCSPRRTRPSRSCGWTLRIAPDSCICTASLFAAPTAMWCGSGTRTAARAACWRPPCTTRSSGKPPCPQPAAPRCCCSPARSLGSNCRLRPQRWPPARRRGRPWTSNWAGPCRRTTWPFRPRSAPCKTASQRRRHQAQSRNAGLEENNQALAQQCATWQLEATRLRQDCAQLVQHLKTIETSTVFRATRPLVHAKMRIDRLLGRTPRQRAAPQAVPIAAPDHPVDIIVPVYQGLADTQRCLASVLSATCHSAYRLIVIDDASPEPALSAWLRQRAAQDSRITLLENPENLGFVGTVNRGMALSDSHDVLLLNSDTEVTGDWLDRLRRAAYGDRKIASVTPLSNNATICSYPRFCQANELPAGYDSARLDALCAQTNPGAVVDVPTGVGFCMYIRRDCLKQLSLFYSENFGKGYGEENHFCQRAAKADWRNLQLLDTFVLHTGGVSFGDSKSQRERAALQTLRRLHPGYESAVMAFVQADPARPYRLALDTARIVRSGLPVVLAVLHDRAGGTLRHVRDLAQHLSGQALFLTLTPAPGRSVSLQLACAGEGFELVFR